MPNGGVGDNLSPEQRWRHAVVTSLHRWDDPDPANHWNPHQGQQTVLEAIFKHQCKMVFCQCGRKWGKTEVIMYSLWRWALMKEHQTCYYICPELKQAKEIVWRAKDRRGKFRVKEFGSAEFVEHIDETENRVVFKNGSSIKVDGSDNYDAWAGISPHFVVLDEFRSFRPEFYGVMNPNRASFNAPMIIIGTPPPQIWIDKDTPHQYVEVAHEAKLDMFETGNSFHIKRPSWDNPDPIIQEFLRSERKSLERRNKMHEWWREYGAELVQGGESKVFPNFISDATLPGTHVFPHSHLLDLMYHA